jgi:hypothetical protein
MFLYSTNEMYTRAWKLSMPSPSRDSFPQGYRIIIQYCTSYFVVFRNVVVVGKGDSKSSNSINTDSEGLNPSYQITHLPTPSRKLGRNRTPETFFFPSFFPSAPQIKSFSASRVARKTLPALDGGRVRRLSVCCAYHESQGRGKLQ